MENNKFIGTLESVEVLPGLINHLPKIRKWFFDLNINENIKICVGKRDFYRRLNEGPTIEELEECRGKKVEVHYSEEHTITSDYKVSKWLRLEENMPQDYNQIISIRKLK